MTESPVAIITGAAQGIGAAMCTTLLQEGYKVCISDIQGEKLTQFAKEQKETFGSDNIKSIACDVTKQEDYKGLFDFALIEFKRIDLVLNNAGIFMEDDPMKTLQVNLMGPIIGCQLALQYMGKSNGGKGGMVINTASDLGFIPFEKLPVYCATKHGIVGLTRSYGTPYYLDRDGVIFSAICPACTDTALMRKCFETLFPPDFDVDKEYDVMTPEFAARGILKLLEDRINGSTLLATAAGYTYIGYQEEFKKAPVV